MPNWKEIDEEIAAMADGHDTVRRKYLAQLVEKTGRNVIAYYSGWLQRGGRALPTASYQINDGDKNAFMVTVNKLDRAKGLDLILHSPGGEVAATESIIDYLRAMFGTDIRAIVPQIAMSGGTMIALACKCVLMGKHSNIGPIDPQFGGMPAHAILSEFEDAISQIKAEPVSAHLWKEILGKLPPTLITSAKHAIAMAEDMVRANLVSGMFNGDLDAAPKAQAIITGLTDLHQTKMHARHISRQKAADLQIKVEEIEANPELQDLILSVHHSYIHTLASKRITKMTENHLGVGFVERMELAT